MGEPAAIGMKLCFSSLPCKDWTIDKTIEICKQTGIRAIELRLNFHNWEVEELKSKLSKENIVISNLGSSVLIRDYDENKIELFKQALITAKELNAKGIRVFLGNFFTRYSEKKPPVSYDGIVKCLKEICDLALQDHVEVWIETHNEFSTGSVLRKLLDDVSRINCKVIWDIIHPYEQGESIEDTIKFIGNDIAHIHVKDGVPYDDPDLSSYQYTKIGEGILPVDRIVKLLTERRYSGYYSLEWESAWREEIHNSDCTGEIIIPKYAEFMNQFPDNH